MTGPTIKGMQLAKALRELREQAGKKQHEAALAIDCSSGKITHLERGRYNIRKTDLESLLRFYGAEDKTEILEELRQQSSEKGWWDLYDLPDWLATHIGIEADANKIQVFELELIPGLLQVEEYAQALYSMNLALTPVEKKQRVNARIKRQTRLISGINIPELELHTIISMGALTRVNNTNFAKKQFKKLQEHAHLDNITIQILPFEIGLHINMLGPFSILSFPKNTQLKSIVSQPTAVGEHIIDDNSVLKYKETYNKLSDQALTPDESLDIISKMIKNGE